MPKLSENEISDQLATVPEWSREGETIVRSFDRGNFVGSIEFANAIVGPAEEMNHHPDLEISWATVKVSITTHSEGGLTAGDFELAGRIDALA